MNKYILGIILLIIIILIYKYYNRDNHDKKPEKIQTTTKDKKDEFDYLLKGEYTLREDEDVNSIYSEKILNIEFIPSQTFKGGKENYVFKLGEHGLGYYSDMS